MREVDEALARVYGERSPADQLQGVPPAPHLSARVLNTVRDKQIETEKSIELQWPAIVLTLERNWGSRFDRMAQLILAARQKHALKVILFTSCHRAEGRTTLVLTLARALSRLPLRTLILDGDLTGPMVGRLLGLRPRVGLEDVVEYDNALGDALIHAPDDHLSLLPMRTAVSRPRDFLASPAWTCTLARLRRQFDLILLDGGPLFTGLSAALLHSSVDAAVLVHHKGITGERAVLRAREVLEAGGITLLGLADTFV
jgi:protein-tyrosine kinase